MEWLQKNVLLKIIIVMLVTLNLVYSSNILAVYPTPSFSHQQPCLNLAYSLAERGHNVTTITPYPGSYKSIPNYHEIDLSILRKIQDDYFKEHNFSFEKKSKPLEVMKVFAEESALLADELLKSEPVQQIIRSSDKKYDLIIYDGLYPGLLGLSHHFNQAPSVSFFPVPLYIPTHFSMGNPINPSYITSLLLEYSDRMSFFERIQNTFYLICELYTHYYYVYPLHDRVVKKHFGASAPSVQQLENRNSLMLLSGDLSQSYPMPLQPNTLLIGTIHMKEHLQPLPEDLKKWMDEAEEGVIYFSLGSNMKGTAVPEDKRNAFAKAFSQFPKFRVLWKWESDIEFGGKPSNVLLRKWMPQLEILAHPKMKLFITQGGQESRQEAIHFGVPVLTIPLFWDQAWNGKKMEVAGAGLMLDFYEITYDAVHDKLNSLLTDNSYKSNMNKLSIISKDKPMDNKETAIWWIEYVLRHKGAPHLRPAVQDLHWYQYTLLDIIAFGLFVILIFMYVIYVTAKNVICKFHKAKPKKIKNK